MPLIYSKKYNIIQFKQYQLVNKTMKTDFYFVIAIFISYRNGSGF